MDSSKLEATKAEEVNFKIEQGDEAASNPGLAFAPLFFDPAAQVAALAVEEAAPIIEDEEPEDLKPDVKPAVEAVHVAAIHHAVKQEVKTEAASDDEEPAPPGEDDDPFGLGPRRSRSPPASRAQRRSIQATASQRPRSKTKFFPSR